MGEAEAVMDTTQEAGRRVPRNVTDRPRAWRSLRLRFSVAFAALAVSLAAAARFVHYQATAELLAWHVDEMLWAKLGGLAAERAVAPAGTMADPEVVATILPDIRSASDRQPSALLRAVMPVEAHLGLGRPGFPWFAGVWGEAGKQLVARAWPAELAWEPGWSERADTIWTTVDGRYRLAATRDRDGGLLVAGTPTERLRMATSEAAFFHAWTLGLTIPVGVAGGWALLTWLLRPLDRIAETAGRIGSGRFDDRIDLGEVDSEIAGLAATLNQMLDRLGEVRNKLARFNANLAHEVLGPVHGILLQADVALERERPAEELRGGIREIRGLGQRMEAICEALLAYSRSVVPAPEMLKPLDLEPVVDAAIEQVAPQANAAGVTIDDRSGPLVVRGEADLLQQVFTNLLANAVAHSPAGGSVAVETVITDRGLAVRVIDHGAGVDPTDEPRIFEHFFSGSGGEAGRAGGGELATGTDRPRGHGLGLAICQSIMRSHGGEVCHLPTPGGGATFEVRFPPPAR
jgi:signal transduction histidine kinase